jgi:uncharacterized protein YyaL (SSP411 family)
VYYINIEKISAQNRKATMVNHLAGETSPYLQQHQRNPVDWYPWMAAFAQWLFAHYEHEPENYDRASRMVARVNNDLRDYPTSFGYWLQVSERLRQETNQVVLISPANLNSLEPFLAAYRERYRPNDIIAARIADNIEKKALPGILNDRPVIDGKPTAYVCQGFICRAPVTDVELFKTQLSQ